MRRAGRPHCCATPQHHQHRSSTPPHTHQQAMESPGLESPMDGEDAVYPCKGCGEVRHSPLEEAQGHCELTLSCADLGGRQGFRARYVMTTVPLTANRLTDIPPSQPATDGTLTASDVTLAAPCSTPTPTCSSSATVPSSATTVHIAAMPAATRSKTWPSSPATRPFARAASAVATARGRLRTCAMRALLRVSFA